MRLDSRPESPALKAMGAIKAFGLCCVDQRFPNVKGTEPLRELG